ncbi:MAG: tetratricopeptide repeat protein [Candidatus Onthovivens sp.]|nr:tetratricopeptide repeat protein [Candidatus Onthovivens sp.]
MKNSEKLEVFNLLSKLMSEEIKKNDNEEEISYIFNELMLTIDNLLIPAIEKIQYDKKYDMVDKIKKELMSIMLYTKFPLLINKSVIGFYKLNTSRNKSIFNKYLKKQYSNINKSIIDKIKLMVENNNIDFKIFEVVPTIISYNTNENIETLNLAGNIIKILKEEYMYITNFSKKNNLNLSAILYLLYFETPNLNKEQSAIIFPKEFDSTSKYYNAMINSIDIMIIEETMVYKKEFIDILNESNVSTLIIIGKSKDRENIIKKFKNKKINCIFKSSINDVYKLIDTNSEYGSKNNFCFKFIIENYLSDIRYYLSEQRFLLDKEIESVNKDLLTIDDKNKIIIKNIQKNCIKNIELIDNLKFEYDKIYEKIINLVDKIQKKFNIIEDEEYYNEHIQMENIFLELLIKEINHVKTYKYENCYEVIRKYGKIYSKISGKEFVPRVLINNLLKEKQETTDLEKFANYFCDNQYFIKEKINLHEELKLDINKCADLIFLLSSELSSEEHLILGKYYYSKNKIEEAKEEFIESVKKGNKEAGDLIIKYCDIDENGLKYLADIGVAEAAYKVGLAEYNTTKDKNVFMKYLIIAAAQSHLGAIKLLGNMFFEEAMSVFNDEKLYEPIAKEAKKYYELAISLGSKDKKILENVGIICFDLRDYKEAKDYFEKSQSAESNYHLGLMYEKAYGFAEDDKKALEYYELAMNKGHNEAQVAYEKLNNKIYEAQKKNTVKDGVSYSSSSYYSGYYSSYYSGYSSGW